ncbi:CU044_2847 family protein [Streptomyces mobaraensis]|uniref:CU044_2847 family protein n=1 Tax=Streptomyces mobaraensis TaxID=35621 RepID=UPI00331CE1E9
MSERRPPQTVEVPLNDGQDIVRVQVSEVDESLMRVGRGGRVAARAEQSLRDMMGVIRPVADAFVGRCGEIARPPDEATLEFGVSVSADAKVAIASVVADANFAVRLTWNGRSDGDPTPAPAPAPAPGQAG